MQARDGLTMVQGTPLEQSDVDKAFDGTAKDPVQAVLVTLNATRASDSPFAKPVAPPNFVQDCVRNATTVMKGHGVKRIVVMSAFGIGSSWPQLPWLMKALFRYTNMSAQMQDHEATDKEVGGLTDLDWTFVRPVVLKEGGSLPVKNFGETGKGVGLFNGITRASVAEFMVKTMEESSSSKKAMVISN